MLRVKSFDISDYPGINELLSKYRLAPGGHILVSDGKVCIPYEDGLPMNNAHKVVAIGEERNKMLEQRALIVHSQKVVDLQIADAQDKFNVAYEAWKANTSNKKLEDAKNQEQSALSQAENLKLTNSFEIVRIDRNIELFEEEMKSLA